MSQHAQGSNGQRLYQLRLRRHTGMLVVMRTKTYTVQGTLEQCEAAYKAAQRYNLIAGWWGILSLLVMNWIAIFGNMSAMSQLRGVAAGAPVPALR